MSVKGDQSSKTLDSVGFLLGRKIRLCIHNISWSLCQVFSIILAKSYVVLGVLLDHILYITEACNLYS